MIDDRTIKDAIAVIVSINGLNMDPDDLAYDVVLMAIAWPEEVDFKHAVVSTCEAMEHLINGVNAGTRLKYDLSEWTSFHFQHRRAQGQKADMRIIYRRTEDGIQVMAFGHRHRPNDIYWRIRMTR